MCVCVLVGHRSAHDVSVRFGGSALGAELGLAGLFRPSGPADLPRAERKRYQRPCSFCREVTKGPTQCPGERTGAFWCFGLFAAAPGLAPAALSAGGSGGKAPA